MEITSALIDHRIDNGLKYQKFDISANGKDIVPIHILLVDSRKNSIDITKSIPTKEISDKDLYKVINKNHSSDIRPNEDLKQHLPLQKVSSLLLQNSNYFYGINGSFFMYYEDLKHEHFNANTKQSFYGDPIGWFRVDGKDYSFPYLNRNALIVYKNSTIDFKKVSLLEGKLLSLRTKELIRFEDRDIEDKLDSTIYFTKGKYVKTNRAKLKISFVGNTVVTVNNKELDTEIIEIPSNGFIVSISTDFDVKTGDQFRFLLNSPNMEITNAVSIGPTLVRDGAIVTNDVWENEDFVDFPPKTLTKNIDEYPCARTAVFNTTDNLFGFIVTEGAPSVGLTLKQLAIVAKVVLPNLKDCIYLDGGGCSTICRQQNGKAEVLNLPSGVSNQKVMGTKTGKESYVGYVFMISRK